MPRFASIDMGSNASRLVIAEADDPRKIELVSYDRVPVRQSVANSQAYLKGDPFRKLTADEMLGRKWLIPAPGAAAMRADIMNVVPDILERNVSIPDALAKAQASIQTKLDQALGIAK